MDLLNGPTEKQYELIKEELNENQNRFKHNLELFKSWISCQDHLPKNYDVRMLPILLRGCKHDLNKAKEKFEHYFMIKTTFPKIYAGRNIKCTEYMNAIQAIPILPLKNLNSDGSRVIISNLISKNITIEYDIILQYIFMIADIRLFEETVISGDTIVFDLENFTFKHMANFPIFLTNMGIMALKRAYPQRVKYIHVINLPPYAIKLVKILMHLLETKIQKRVIIHDNKEGILKYVDSKILPVELGGSAGDLRTIHENWQQYLIEKNDWLINEGNLKIIGPIPNRLQNAYKNEIMDDVHGSFRQLNID